MKKLMILIFLLCSLVLHGENFRETHKEAWSATSINDALLKLYGTTETLSDMRIDIKAPKVASNGGAVPLVIKTTILAKSIAIFQDVNPTALVAVYSVHEKSLHDYLVKIKMQSTGMIMVVVEGVDGKLYRATQRVEVALGGCEGGGSYIPVSVSRVEYNTEEYASIKENKFKEVSTSPLSTFSADVDTASYSNVRRHLFSKHLPQKDVVRSEELINYFTYNYEEPKSKEPFAIHTKVGQSIWNKESKVIQIALQTKKVDTSKLPVSNLVFLLDVSGSMGAKNKLPLLTKSLELLVKQLRKKDRVSIVVYAGNSGLVLDRARDDEKSKIINALNQLNARGSTAGGEGIKLAYDVAQKAFIEGGNNRIILATDGDFNVGVRSQNSLVELIEEKRKSGVYLTVLGFGMGNYKDNKVELLSDKGNGNYAYIDNLLEAKKVLVTQLSGTLYTVAKDVKIQVEFNPKKVHSYRLIGYENRVLNNEDFKNDKVDAGEIGMGHSVTALYEVMLKSENLTSMVDKLKYQSVVVGESSELATVKIRYKEPDGDTSMFMRKAIKEDESSIVKKDYDFVQTVAGFSMLLRKSEFNKGLKYKELIELAKDSKGEDREGYRADFIKIVEQAELLSM